MNNTTNQPAKKRKYTDSPPGTITPASLNNLANIGNPMLIKQEPNEANWANRAVNSQIGGKWHIFKITKYLFLLCMQRRHTHNYM